MSWVHAIWLGIKEVRRKSFEKKFNEELARREKRKEFWSSPEGEGWAKAAEKVLADAEAKRRSQSQKPPEKKD